LRPDGIKERHVTSPTSFFWSGCSSDSEEGNKPSLLSPFSPSDTAEARQKREEMPLFTTLPGHGVTTYSLVPEDRSIDVEDESTVATGRDEYKEGDVRSTTEGSTNGFYLPETDDLRALATEIQASHYSRNPIYRAAMHQIAEVRHEANSWAHTVAALHVESTNPCAWLNKTWGPPIRDRAGKILLKLAHADETRHPSLVGALTSTYGGHKRHSDSELSQSRAVKKPKKKHKRYTWPADAGARHQQPLNDLHTAAGKGPSKSSNIKTGRKVVLLPPKPPLCDDGCANCAKKASKSSKWACHKCYRFSYRSAECRNNCKGQYCCEGCLDDAGDTLIPSMADARRCLQLEADPGHKSKVHANNETAGKDNTEPRLSSRAANEQVQAMQQIERKRLKGALNDFVAAHVIINWQISRNGRVLQYGVQNVETGRQTWCNAFDLRGAKWDKKMAAFWKADENARVRDILENPDGEHRIEPGPFGQFICRADIIDDRAIMFEIRDFERAAEEDFGEEEYWFEAQQVGTS